jgi:hypothetical protein
MDVSQIKLSRSEWENIEKPVSEYEKQILKMIKDGYSDINIRANENQTMFSLVQINKTSENETILYKKYFEPLILEIIGKYGGETPMKDYTAATVSEKKIAIKSADKIRLQNLDANITKNKKSIFEYLLLDLSKEMLKQIHIKNQKYAFYLYTLLQLKKTSIKDINAHVVDFVDKLIEFVNGFTKTSEIIKNAYQFIEKNPHILKYEDKVLFAHQKELFSLFSQSTNPKLVLYMAPTGTGKTVSPIGLAQGRRIIFVCVARHIGLALAKSAISVEQKVAFAFGCETASDIRLHYFSAVDYTKNRKSGGIGKVDNSNGNNVEIMICDVHSYITAMHYMIAFNDPDDIITYWDEPTITLDQETHELHKTISRNWKENKIPNMVLSCATLPTSDELQPVFDDFREKFDGANIHTITSFDCKKSIPIIDKNGYCVLPHLLYSPYSEMIECVKYCDQNKTLLRYFDLREIIHFIEYIDSHKYVEENFSIDSYFKGNIQLITMNSLKEYYLCLLLHIEESEWHKIHHYLKQTQTPKFTSNFQRIRSVDSYTEKHASNLAGQPIRKTASVSAPTAAEPSSAAGILLTTSDAYTLTDGPTIFLADDVNKVGMFYRQQTNISKSTIDIIMAKLENNEKLSQRIEKCESLIREKETKTSSSDASSTKDSAKRESGRLCKESEKFMAEINKHRAEIKMVSLDPAYLPNTKQHQEIWAPIGETLPNAFVSNIDEVMAKEIMLLDIDRNVKILLMLGIGLFSENIANNRYMEIMKQLADEQNLFIIIASSDYIYGTNYQFCHGFIGKDLKNMTQQKTLQAMGRIGRNNIQQDYTIRFRDNDMIMRLFKKPEYNLEAVNMCKLFGQ